MAITLSKLPVVEDSKIRVYQSADGNTKVEVRMDGESVWLTLNQLAELFQRNKLVISRHIKNVFEEGELHPDSVVAYFATTAADGKIYQVNYYNLDMIISADDRVKSHRGWGLMTPQYCFMADFAGS